MAKPLKDPNGSYFDVRLRRPFLEDLGRSRLEKGSSTWKKVKVFPDVTAAPLFGGSRPLTAGKGVQQQRTERYV